MRRRIVLAVLVVASAAWGCDRRSGSGGPASAEESAEKASAERVEIKVDSNGYHPAQVEVPAGRPVTLVFRRVEEAGCADTVVIPSEDIEKKLPVGEDVEIALPPPEPGEIAFTCGMSMLKGRVIAK